MGVWISRDAAGQFWTQYSYSSNPIIFIDADGNWFGIDDAIAAGIGFVAGYVGAGLSGKGWGGRAAVYGLIGAVAADLTLNTGGAVQQLQDPFGVQ